MILYRCRRWTNGNPAHDGVAGRRSSQRRRSEPAHPRLEQLEQRLTPTNFATTTTVAVSITPNIAARTATETVTAAVTNNDPSGPPVTSGGVLFNVNDILVGGALNSSGQTSASFTLPLSATGRSQTIEAAYDGATVGANTFQSSVLLTPAYLNALNALFPANVTFLPPAVSQSSLPVTAYATYFGESDDVTLLFVPVDFNYVDPGTVQNFTILGFTLPGSASVKLFAPLGPLANSVSNELL